MSYEFRMPEIGEGVMEGEIVEWLIAEGAQVEADQPVLSVLTDKATVEIAAPQAGIVAELRGAAGDMVEVGNVIAVFTEVGGKVEAKPAPASNAQAIVDEAPAKGTEFQFPLPEIGEGVMEGEVVEWHVAVGDQLIEDQPLISVLTDKATVEITSPINGVVRKLHAQAGDIIEVGHVLATFESSEGLTQTVDAPKATVVEPLREEPKVAAAANAVDPASNPSISAFGTPLATPAVRRLASKMGIDLSHVRGSGPHHRITRSDVESFTASPATQATPTATPAAGQAPVSLPRTEADKRVAIKGLRKAIYTNMTKAKQIVPHFTYVEEIEMDRMVAMRAGIKDLAAEEGAKLSYLPFIAKAISLSIRKFPIMNVSVDDAAMEILYKDEINIGIATSTEHGLMVPVVKDADKKTVVQLAKEIEELAGRARARKSSPADLSDGTFTITSLGRLGGLLATPIINHPEVAIFGVHNMVDRAVVRDGQIVIRKMMNVAVAFDHRVVDGDVGAAFTQEVKTYLENPDKFLLHLA